MLHTDNKLAHLDAIVATCASTREGKGLEGADVF